MVKAPISGAVKTRLARSIGAVQAARFYRSTTRALLHRLGRDPRWRTLLAVAPDTALAAPFWPASLPRIAQGRGDLGARMQRIFDRLAPAPTVVIGSDIPAVRARDIAHALARLRARHAVLGPAGDGGYWLVAMRAVPRLPRPFAHVRWSGTHALADTLRNLQAARHTIGFAVERRDVDAARDLAALSALAGRIVLPPPLALP